MKIFELTLNAEFIMQDEALVAQINSILEDEKYHGIVLQAPQGSGKSRLIQSLDAKAIMTPTRALREQQLTNYGYERIVGRGARIDFFIYTREKPEISTMASSLLLNLSDLDYLIFDECHKLVDYSTFASSTTDAVLQTMNDAVERRAKVICISATPQKLLYHYDLMERVYRRKNPIDCIIKIVPKTQKKYIKTLYVYMHSKKHYQKIKNMIKRQPKDEQQVVLMRRNMQVYDFTEELNRAHEKGKSDLNAIGFTSENTYANPDFDRLTKEGLFSSRVLNTTSLIDCGIDLNSPKIGNLCNLFTSDLTMHYQFAARARNAQPNYHLHMGKLSECKKELLKLDDATLFHRLKKQCIDLLPQVVNDHMRKNMPGAAKADKDEYIYSDLALTSYIIKLQDGARLSTEEGIKEAFAGMYEDYVFVPTDRFLRETASKRKAQKIAAKAAATDALAVAKVEIAALLEKWRGRGRLNRAQRDGIIAFMNGLGVEGKQLGSMIKRLDLPYTVEDVGHGRGYRVFKL